MNGGFFGRWAVLLLVAVLPGCADFSGIGTHVRELMPAALGAREVSAADWPATDWWRGFNDPQLDALIDRALEGNPNLQLVAARRARAEAAAGLVDSANGPHLDLNVDSTRRRFSENAEIPPPYAGSTRSVSHFRLDGSWEIDFFGRNRAALAAAVGQVHAAEAEAQAARVLLAADVAQAYFRLATLRERRTVAEAMRRQRADIHELVASRVRAGLDTAVELRQAEGALPEARRDLASIDEQIALARHALAALLGEGPEALGDLAPAQAGSALPALPAALPADLLGRRADLVAARWRVEAATHNVESARAAFYPNVNLVGLAGFSSIGLDNWFKAGSRESGIGIALHLPIFDAGRLRANLGVGAAEADAALAGYNATLIQAVREVADQLASQRAVEQQIAEQQQTLAAAEAAFELARQRYAAGLGNYLNVLIAENNVLAQRRNATELKGRRMATQVQLIRALGGGYAGS